MQQDVEFCIEGTQHHEYAVAPGRVRIRTRAASLRGVPLAIDDRTGFPARILVVHHAEPYGRGGVPWVTSRPGWATYIAEFSKHGSGKTRRML
jgi:hypothetical protein